MARKVEVRTSYQNDARYLMRFMEAVEKDAKIPLDDRKSMISNLKHVVIMLTKLSGSTLGET